MEGQYYPGCCAGAVISGFYNGTEAELSRLEDHWSAMGMTAIIASNQKKKWGPILTKHGWKLVWKFPGNGYNGPTNYLYAKVGKDREKYYEKGQRDEE